MKKSGLIIILTVFTGYLFGQNNPKYYQSNSIKVYDSSGRLLKNPFGGGLKNPYFASIDLNGDGYDDLVVLDRIDNRLLVFINQGIKDSIAFKYFPSYELLFPDSLSNIIIFKDYNYDGKPDLFTFASWRGQGLCVYKNITQGNLIQFELVSSVINTTYYGGPEFPLYVLQGDIPGIVDIDGDSALDILTFDDLGGHIQYFRNLSKDSFGDFEHLNFVLANDCWGSFVAQIGNKMILDTNCSSLIFRNSSMDTFSSRDSILNSSRALRHAGSTIFAKDMDNDGDIDVLVGDIDWPGIVMLKNGKSETHHMRDTMISAQQNFPPNTFPINIKQMPGIFSADINNDGIKDIISSPMENYYLGNYDTIDNLNQVWAYLNIGTNQVPKYEYLTNNFLQDEMIDLGEPTSPTFFDYDGDGDQDLFISTCNYAQAYYPRNKIVLYENIGSASNPVFKLKTNDYLNLSSHNYQSLTIAFGDIDGDHKKDLILGHADGKISYYKNVSTNDTAKFLFVTDFLDSINVGGFSAPLVVDLNGDSLGDLLIGQDSGQISYYQNIGSLNNPKFKLITRQFGNIHYNDNRHFTSVAVGDLDHDGKPDMVVSLNIWNDELQLYVANTMFYEDIDNTAGKTFAPMPVPIYDNSFNIPITRSLGERLRPAIADLNNQGYPDLVFGCSRGGLLLYSTNKDTNFVSINPANRNMVLQAKVYPNPATNYINIVINNNINYSGLQVCLYDIYGRKLINKSFNGDNYCKIDIGSLTTAPYIIQVSDNSSRALFSKCIIKI